MAGIFGLYGVMIGLILIANHLLSLKSFGIPYLSPLVPGEIQGMKDLLVRGPLWWMNKRPSFLQPANLNKLAENTFDEMKNSAANVLDPKNDKNQQEG